MMAARREASAPPTIQGYEFTRVLGLGGFADVFLYQQLLPRRPVAVKVLLASSLDAESRRRFQSEANVMAQLSHHPSIVTIYQADIAPDGRPYLVMEYCSRPGLGARYRAERIAVAEALRIGIRLAAAVETAHRAGILHRDIKPANVLTTDFGWPALTDFGIAETVGFAESASIGMSIPWSPPELLADVPTGDERADVYSLAATIYSLLARRSPFEVPDGPNTAADLVARIERVPLPPTGRGDVPESLQAVLARAMSKDPAHRYPSAVAVARALREVEAELALPQTAIDVEEDRTVPPAGAGDGFDPAGTREADQPTRVRPVVSIDPSPAPGAETRVRPVVVPVLPTPRVGPSDLAVPAPSDPATGVAVPDDASPADVPLAGPTSRVSPAPTARVDVPTFATAPPVPRVEAEGQPLPAVVLPGRHRRSGAVTTVAGALVVAAALVAVSLAVIASRDGAPTGPGTGGSTGDRTTVAVRQVPAPTSLTGVREADGSILFTWTNPDPQPGDQFLWGVLPATGQPELSLVDQPQVRIAAEDLPEPVAGSAAPQVCIEVSVVRTDRRASTTPAEACA